MKVLYLLRLNKIIQLETKLNSNSLLFELSSWGGGGEDVGMSSVGQIVLRWIRAKPLTVVFHSAQL